MNVLGLKINIVPSIYQSFGGIWKSKILLRGTDLKIKHFQSSASFTTNFTDYGELGKNIFTLFATQVKVAASYNFTY